ncbi:peptidylprolyl isomerase [Bacillus pseudomycoides]|uniref:peptidylprolyl isomerase n=1 Tax=Bacillus pseudomycoides TaxID=64104 RepID=UPI000BF29B42|nr:peptidylprolyl isomerase [Bacillus pseudomycoides]MED1474520.1 peptidylprolyl isomerase [Bacillus pseudomycoides]MED3346931.1 peptidylprolyl isomerase [Bacillus thuringiensis]PEO88125.1 peptidylprolyl isomerase [Bacillus pseudomycoides]PEP86108.1 peptidylprolyl isomerase [Bacillus pseudomycoides]
MSLTNLQKKKLQIELNPKKDKTIYNLIAKLEQEGEGEKGYVNKQVKKRLEMYQVLSEVAGEDDPIELVKKLLINIKTHGVQNDAGEDEKPSDDAVDSAMNLIAGLNDW